MSKFKAKQTVLSLLSLQSLIATQVQAQIQTQTENSKMASFIDLQNHASMDSERILQKKIVGFDPKQAIETLSFLKNVGIQKFEKDGTVMLDQTLISDLIESASIDGIEVRILKAANNTIQLKLAAPQVQKFDRNRMTEAFELADHFKLKCDMDGKILR